MKNKILSLMLTILVSSCASTVQVLDDKGIPVKGALVITEQASMFGKDHLAIYITNENGEAKTVNHIGHIFKKGFYPVINASVLDDMLLSSSDSLLSGKINIFPIKEAASNEVELAIVGMIDSISYNNLRIPFDTCSAINVYFNVEANEITVISTTNNLLESEWFFFYGSDSTQKLTTLTKKNNVAFYCKEQEQLYKVGISLSEDIWRNGSPAHTFALFTTKVDSLNVYVQPQIKCLEDSMNEIRVISRNQFSLYTSKNLKEKLKSYSSSIPCSESFAESFIQYLEQNLWRAE